MKLPAFTPTEEQPLENVHPKLCLSLSLSLSPLCPQLKNRLTQVSGTKQVGHRHILREGESELKERDKIASGW